MNPRLSSSLPRSPGPRRHARRREVVLTLLCLLTAVRPFPVSAARSSSAGAGTHLSSPVNALPSNVGTGANSNNNEANALNKLDRLPTPPAQGYDIVPPAHPNQASSGPLPGYQLIRLGRGRLNRLFLAGTIGGTKGLMMLDTGAGTTALSDTTYRSLLLNAAYTLPAGLPRAVNFNGTRTPLAEAPDFYVGDSDLGAVPVCLLPRGYLVDPGIAGGKERRYDGLLGENILRHYNAMVDCTRLLLYLNVDPSRKFDPAASFIRHGWTRVSMADTGNDFTVPCVLNGHRFRLIVDTGAPFTNLDRHLLAAAQISARDLPLRSSLIGTPTERVGLVDLDRVEIGSYTATDVHMTTTSQSLASFDVAHSRASDEPIVGLLGGDFLATNGAVVDIGDKALYLKHPVSKPSKNR